MNAVTFCLRFAAGAVASLVEISLNGLRRRVDPRRPADCCSDVWEEDDGD